MHAFQHNLTGVYHVGTGVETSVNQLWNILQTSTGTSITPEYVSALGEIQRTALDANKLKETGWNIRFDVQTGIQSLL